MQRGRSAQRRDGDGDRAGRLASARPPAVGVVGLSDAGKTTVAAGLVGILSGRGYRVGAVKHAPHGHNRAPSAVKDSQRLLGAGAARVVVTGPAAVTIEAPADSRERSLSEVLALFDGGFDVVVVEGFKTADVPAILVHGEGPLPQWPSNRIAVVTRRGEPGGGPCFAPEQLDELADLVVRDVIERRPRPAVLSLEVDGAPVGLRPFPAEMAAGALRGMLATLDGVDADAAEIRITLRRRA